MIHYSTVDSIGNQYSPINLEYFLNIEIQQGGGGKEIIHQNSKLKTIKDIVMYFSNKDNITKTEKTLNPSNWQYYNCMIAEFRHNVKNHHDLGWENMTKEYYEGLDPMSDEEIEQFLKNNPVEFNDAVEFDKKIRRINKDDKMENFTHKSCVPLDQVEFKKEDESKQIDMFNNECEGMCGV